MLRRTEAEEAARLQTELARQAQRTLTATSEHAHDLEAKAAAAIEDYAERLRELTDAREAAETAAAEQARAHTEAASLATDASNARTEAEQTAETRALEAADAHSARTEAEKTLADQLRALTESESRRAAAEESAHLAHLARERAEQAAESSATRRQAAEQAALAQADLLAQAEAGRLAAERRAQALAEQLEETRGVLLHEVSGGAPWWQPRRRVTPDTDSRPDETPRPATATPVTPASRRSSSPGFISATPAAEPDPVPTSSPAAAPAAAELQHADVVVAHREPEPEPPTITRPETAPERQPLQQPARLSPVTVVLAGIALIAAGVAVQAALADGLFTARAAIAAGIALVLVWILLQRRARVTEVYLEDGVVHVEGRESHVRFDLGNPNVRVELAGSPEDRDWKVLFLRRSLPPFVVNRKLADPELFTEAVRQWRPEL